MSLCQFRYGAKINACPFGNYIRSLVYNLRVRSRFPELVRLIYLFIQRFFWEMLEILILGERFAVPLRKVIRKKNSFKLLSNLSRNSHCHLSELRSMGLLTY